MFGKRVGRNFAGVADRSQDLQRAPVRERELCNGVDVKQCGNGIRLPQHQLAVSGMSLCFCDLGKLAIGTPSANPSSDKREAKA